MKIYVDLDGVLADFDSAAQKMLNTDNHYKYDFIWGPEAYWKRLHANGDFFAQLEPMPDAYELWDAVSPFKPVILTALPKTEGERVDRQKRKWVHDYINIDAEVITCATKDKPKFCKPGDILIDDRAVNLEAWKSKGGIYIIHTDAARTIGTLKALGVIV